MSPPTRRVHAVRRYRGSARSFEGEESLAGSRPAVHVAPRPVAKNCRHRETARHVAHQPDLHRHFPHASGQGGREIRSEYGRHGARHGFPDRRYRRAFPGQHHRGDELRRRSDPPPASRGALRARESRGSGAPGRRLRARARSKAQGRRARLRHSREPADRAGHRDRGARLQAPCLPGARQGSLQPGGRIGSHRDAAEVAHDRLRVAFRTPYGGQPPLPGTLRALAARSQHGGLLRHPRGHGGRREGGARLGDAARVHSQSLPQRTGHHPLQGGHRHHVVSRVSHLALQLFSRTRRAISPTSSARTSPRATSPTAPRRSCAPSKRPAAFYASKAGPSP